MLYIYGLTFAIPQKYDVYKEFLGIKNKNSNIIIKGYLQDFLLINISSKHNRYINL